MLFLKLITAGIVSERCLPVIAGVNGYFLTERFTKSISQNMELHKLFLISSDWRSLYTCKTI